MLEFRGLVRRPRCGHLSAEKLFANRTSRHLATRQELSSKASFGDDFRIDYPPRSGQAAAGRGKMHDRPLSGFMMQTYASIVGTYGRFPRYRVRPRWHRVRGTSYSRAGVALGAFGLAVGANIHSLLAGSTQHRHLLLLSLGIWPVITALPAFLVAFGTNMVLARVLGSVEGSS
jgi:hypothetical protein